MIELPLSYIFRITRAILISYILAIRTAYTVGQSPEEIQYSW